MPLQEGEHPIVIPRPPGARPGREAPWVGAELPSSVSQMRTALANYSPLAPDRSIITPSMREAAVMMPLCDASPSPELLFIKRPGHMPSHRGEIAFPGGGRDSSDETLWSTAVREAEEEIALSPVAVDLVAELETQVTVGSRYVLTPFIAEVAPDTEIAASSPEADRVLRVSIARLAERGVFREEIWPWGGEERPIFFFDLDADDVIWGATGRMVYRLLCLITGSEVSD